MRTTGQDAAARKESTGAFSHRAVGWARMFNERGGVVWGRVWLKLEERRDSFCPSSLWLTPPPHPLQPQTSFVDSHSRGCFSGKAPKAPASCPPTQTWLWSLSSAGWSDSSVTQTKQGGGGQHPHLRRIVGHPPGWNSAVRGHKASLESWRLPNFGSPSGSL